MTRELRAGRVLACVAACLLLLCAFYIAAEAGHDCQGVGCPVCAHMRLCLNTLQSLLIITAAVSVFAATLRKPAWAPGVPGRFRAAAHTPVSLKVRMDS